MAIKRREEKNRRAQEKIANENEDRRERKIVPDMLPSEKKKEYRKNKISKKTTASVKTSQQKRKRKTVKISANQRRIDKETAIYEEKCEANKAYRNSPEGKQEFERLRQEKIAERKAKRVRAKKIKAAEKKAKRPEKPLYKWKNPISLDYSKGGDQGQGYAMTTPATKPGQRRYVLQTFINHLPAITPDHLDLLTVGINKKKSTHRREFFENLENIFSQTEKSNSLAIISVIGTDFTVEKTQILPHECTLSYNFSNKDNVQTLIQEPLLNSLHHTIHFNRLKDFSQDYCDSFDEKINFVETLNKVENISTDHWHDLTSQEMIDILAEEGYQYDFDDDLTAEDFKTIQTDILNKTGSDIIPPYVPAPLSADEMIGTLRFFTDKSVTQFFKENKIPHFAYEKNPKSNDNKLLKSPIAPINNPLENPGAALNMVQLSSFIANKTPLFSQTQINRIACATGLHKRTQWPNNIGNQDKKPQITKTILKIA